MRLGLDCRKDFSDKLLTFGRQLACTDVISGGGAVISLRSGDGPPYLEQNELSFHARAHRGSRHETACHRESAVLVVRRHLLRRSTVAQNQIEHWKDTLRSMGRAGIPVLGYCLMEGSSGRYSTRTDMAAAIRGGASATEYTEDQIWRMPPTMPAPRGPKPGRH